ncbi:MAG: relaxase/mobilization nuclease domain-containing protein, partial [Halothiobacillus sp.]|nr:relaxase/mobilization nuclease domain-containing protein [Halothiobacillus sp.]
MIVKKVPSSKTKHKTSSIRDLTDYIREPHNQNPAEKVLYANGRGFFSDGHVAQREEMVALAAESVRSKNPVNHYIMSWREGEQPSPEQVEEAVSIFMDELGVKDHQAIYGLHRDTDNIHLHIAINRVHPETLKAVKINNGFDIEAAHKAIARIENTQGWQREQNGRYQVLENGDLGRAPYDPKKPRQPNQKKRDMENRTGEKSAERIAIEDGAAIIKQAQSWEQLHRELAAKGMRYEKTGSGATVFVGDVGVKASDVDRNASLAKMQKRLGEYQPALQRQQVAQREPEPIKPDVPGWKDYITGRKAHYAAKNADKLAQDKRHEQERKQLAERQKARRDELMRGNWKGKGEVLNAMRSVIAAEQASEKAALKEKHKKEREQHRQRFRPYPDFERWQRMQLRPDLAEQWRYRASEPQCIEGDRNERMRLDRQPMSAAKALRKTLKHTAWLVIAAATGGA